MRNEIGGKKLIEKFGPITQKCINWALENFRNFRKIQFLFFIV